MGSLDLSEYGFDDGNIVVVSEEVGETEYIEISDTDGNSVGSGEDIKLGP